MDLEPKFQEENFFFYFFLYFLLVLNFRQGGEEEGREIDSRRNGEREREIYQCEKWEDRVGYI